MIKTGDRTRSVCPVSYALEIFGDRWSLLVLRDVMLEARICYKDMLAANPGLATNVLADRLKRLERRGLLSKKRDPSDARRYVYMPTEAAIALIPMMVEMIVWSARQGAAEAPSSFVKRFETDRNALIAELKGHVRDRIRSR